MIKRMPLIAVLLLVVACACGCSTVMMRGFPEGRGDLAYYPATRYDCWTIRTGGGMYAYGDCDNGLGPVTGWLVVVPLSVLDLPISLVTDTLWLPADIVRDKRENKDAANQQSEGIRR